MKNILLFIKYVICSRNGEYQIVRKILFNILVLFVISIVLGFHLNSIFLFNEETLLWFTSTIVQAFGVIIAIIVTFSLHEVNLISSNYNNVMMQRLPQQGTHKEDIDIKRTRVVDFFNEETEKVRARLYPILFSITLLILTSLFFLSFIKGHVLIPIPIFIEKNIILAIIFTFLFLFSLYTLYELFREIRRVLSLRFQHN